MFSDSSAASDEPDSVEVLHDIPEDLSRAKPVCGVSSARADGTASLGKSLKPRYKPVSEKGLRHIKRIFRVLRGESRVLSAEGRLEDRSVRVLFDMRGDFDVVTTAAVAYPSGGRMRLEYIENPHNVPAYLKAQRHVRVQAVNCKITIKGRSMELQPMLLRGQDPMVLLGRHASTSFLLRISRRPGAKLSRRVLLHRGKQIIQRWMEADSRERQPSQEASQLSSSGGRSDETAGAATTREDTRAANDSDQENVPTKEDAASRRKRATSSSGYFSSAQWREMWSSEEETDARREEKTGDVHTQITEEDSEVAKKFVKFVSYLRDLPVSDFTKKNIVEEDSSDEPEKENASMSDAETVRIIEETSCEIIDTRDGNSVDSFNEKVVINVDDSQVTFNESAVLTLPADTGVGNGASGDGRVPNQGRGGQSFVFFIHACLDKEPTAPTEDVRPVVVRYHIKGNIVHRFYGEDPETLVAVSTVEQASDEPMHLTSRARDDGVATSTPVTSSGPRVVSCVSGTFIDDAVFERPRSSDDKTVAGDTGIPAPRAMASFSMEELLGQYFDPPTTTVID
ncbi:hypothetical protein RF55_14290, partial [Lasius niger]